MWISVKDDPVKDKQARVHKGQEVVVANYKLEVLDVRSDAVKIKWEKK